MSSAKKNGTKAVPIKTDSKKTTETMVVSDKTAITEVDTVDNSPINFPVVGIGASAGGLAAFEAFFSAMPADVDPGMAFVLVQHLAPDHKSILTDLIQRYTKMQVFEVVDGVKVQPNCTYIIPPGWDMIFKNGTLHLLEPEAPRGQRLPIDFFFRSLAEEQHERGICIILSGTGSDGTLGARAIKGEGGLVMAQTSESAEYDGMPRSVIGTGLVDFELPPAEMPARLKAYVSYVFGKSPRPESFPAPKSDTTLKKMFSLLLNQTGNDFSHYKPSTILRRIERRMAVNQIDTREEYVRYMQQTPPEVEALFRDLLIGVTNFFRDPEVFRALEERVIAQMFTERQAGSPVRVWIPGCSTGEEAYSIAILLLESMEKQKRTYPIQVFATDIDSAAIATARLGIYPASIGADISAERLARYFTAEPGGLCYRINKSIRDMLIFSEQNVIKDPPFSKLDLISCRNLMIYLDGNLQKKLVPLFHYSLNPGGFLLLGTSETVGEFQTIFETVEQKAKLYQRKESFAGESAGILSRFLPPLSALNFERPQSAVTAPYPHKLPLKDITEQAILRKIAPVAALVNAQGTILYLHGKTGRYLEPAMGEVGLYNILTMAKEGLRRELSNGLHIASTRRQSVECQKLRVKTNGHYSAVNLIITPVETGPSTLSETALYLVIFEDASDKNAENPTQATHNALAEKNESGPAIDARIEALLQELRAKEEYIVSTTEELETANEELKSSNEEMQSVNEELQSTNEELETSREELQSINEELATVNNELQSKVADLSQANDDMNNLLAGSGIATVFVDRSMRIVRFTPAVTQVINLIYSDIGRPLGHTVLNLVDYSTLIEDVKYVLDTLIPKEIEVKTAENQWFILRIKPYRTLKDVIEGAVLSFVDITELVKTRDALNKANDQSRLAIILRDSYDAVTMQGTDGKTLAWNCAAERMYGWSVADALNMNVRDRIPEKKLLEESDVINKLIQGECIEPYLTQRLSKDRKVINVLLTATPLIDENGKVYGVTTIERQQ